MIDESHSMVLTSTKMLDTTMAQLKSLANITKVPIVLCGTYELAQLSKYDAQVIGRSTQLHFSRYHRAIDQDVNDFRDIADALVSGMPMREPMIATPSIDFLFEGSLGLVGALKQWMLRVLLHAIDDGSKRVTQRHFESTILPLNARRQMLTECMQGEEDLMDSGDVLSFLEELYKAPPGTVQLKPPAVQTHPDKKQLRETRPGRRKPTRDPVNSV